MAPISRYAHYAFWAAVLFAEADAYRRRTEDTIQGTDGHTLELGAQQQQFQQHRSTTGSSVLVKGAIYAAIPLVIVIVAFVMGETKQAVAFFAQYKYAFLIFVPIGLGMGLVGCDKPGVVLAINTLAMIPCAFLIEQSTDVLSEHAGPSIGALLNCTFGNLVEIIIGLSALFSGDIAVVQGNIIGSVYSNFLIVLGLSFLATSFCSKESYFDAKGVTYQFSLLGVGLIGLQVPTSVALLDPCIKTPILVVLSRKVSGVLAVLYVLFVYFKMFTHKSMFDESEDAVVKENLESARGKSALAEEGTSHEKEGEKEEEEEEEQLLSMLMCCLLLMISTYLCSVHCDYLVDSLEPVQEKFGIRKAFSAVVLLPLIGNVSTIYVGLAAGMKNQVNVAVEVALASVTQCVLFVIPLLVYIGWGAHVDMHLIFSSFDSTLLTCVAVHPRGIATVLLRWVFFSKLIRFA
eukprot:TRINITY_DN29428_c0_g2_i1.p1 TRINITY_DN29428_c0_g2~~TRINITY_DN29428_c0_g2_i1.p1  ORF type:complete len:461 (+),score=77.54 TRINITY_DN29428_c0_g2_i1:76-1458(+)